MKPRIRPITKALTASAGCPCNTAKNADERNKAATTPYLARTDSRMMPRQRNSSNRGAMTTSVMIAQKPRP